MENTKKITRKMFFAHQYEKEEKYLSGMRKKGWKFIGVHMAFPTKYEFEACEPEDYSYQLDYLKKEEDTEDYHQMLQDAGWEEVGNYPGLYDGRWYYFCKKKENQKEEQLYTDVTSKMDLMKKLKQTYGLFFAAMFCCEIGAFNNLLGQLAEGRTSWGVVVTTAFCAFALLLFLYNIIGLFSISSKLKKENKGRL